jgi:hypothetical protein
LRPRTNSFERDNRGENQQHRGSLMFLLVELPWTVHYLQVAIQSTFALLGTLDRLDKRLVGKLGVAVVNINDELLLKR